MDEENFRLGPTGRILAGLSRECVVLVLSRRNDNTENKIIRYEARDCGNNEKEFRRYAGLICAGRK